MNKIALFFVIIAVAFACEPEEEVPEIILENSVTDYIEIVKCLLGHEELIKDVTDIIGIVKSQDFTKILVAAIKLYTDGKAAIEQCLDKMLSNDESVNLQGYSKDYCMKQCALKYPPNSRQRRLCEITCNKN